MKTLFARCGWVLCAAIGLGVATSALGQIDDKPAWREAEVAPPAQFRTEGIASFVLEQSATMSLALDPDTVTIGPDDVVRYVLVARSASGALNVLFEGIRCHTAETKTYAYWNANSGWHAASAAEWQPLAFRGLTRRAMQMARGGVCEGRTPNRSPAHIIDTLKRGSNDILRR